jgi:hypothetical protein
VAVHFAHTTFVLLSNGVEKRLANFNSLAPQKNVVYTASEEIVRSFQSPMVQHDWESLILKYLDDMEVERRAIFLSVIADYAIHVTNIDLMLDLYGYMKSESESLVYSATSVLIMCNDDGGPAMVKSLLGTNLPCSNAIQEVWDLLVIQ